MMYFNPLKELCEGRGLGIPVTVVDNAATVITKREQYRFPHCKKRRIRKKWAKRDENWRYLPPEYRSYQTPNGLVMPRKLYEELKKNIETQQASRFERPFGW